MQILSARSALRHLLLTVCLCLYTVLEVGLAWAAQSSAGDRFIADNSDTDRLCVYISSYNRGYSWSDGIERGLRATLAGHCKIEQFDMNTNLHNSIAEIQAAAAEAYALITRLDTDVVITSDDNAAKYLIVPYLADTAMPVVFSGINWTVEEYHFPRPNVTGIVEVAPLGAMISEALAIVPSATRVAYVGGWTSSEQKNFDAIHNATVANDISLTGLFADDFAQWKTRFDEAQTYDFVIIGSHSGIPGWDYEAARIHALENTRRPSFTNHDWMMPVSTIGYTKLPEEHGERAGEAAIAILNGTSPSAIPLLTNRKWETWYNASFADSLEVVIPRWLSRKAKRAL